LKADFREFGGVMAAEEIGEVVLEGAEFQGMVLGGTPFFVAAVGLPIGDVTLSDVKTAFCEGGNDFLLGHIVPEHPINDFAFEPGELGDFAVAGPVGVES
jgi:hypothetical protein